MQKKMLALVLSFILFTLVLTGCKLPASKAPKAPEEDMMTTPIVIVTLSSEGTGEVTSPDAVEPAEPLEEEEYIEDYFAEPTEEPTPTIIVPTLTRPAEYALREGENPYCIARRFDLDPLALLELNNLNPNTLLAAGTILEIPQTSSWGSEDRSLQPHPTTHTVAAGETIYKIACTYGDVSPEAIVAVNQLVEPYELTAGQVLEIP